MAIDVKGMGPHSPCQLHWYSSGRLSLKMLSQLLLCQLPSWKKAPEHIEPAKDAKPAWMISTGMTASCGLVLEGSCTTAVPSAVPASASTVVEDTLHIVQPGDQLAYSILTG